MNRIPLLVLFAVIFTGISVPAYGELITDHVVINEVDTNPFGDDSLAISEWVELYNPTDSEIDLGGWEIASTTVLKKTFTIPDGTVISPEQ
ncbi:MAG: lamin tail domain-containing protein, partial [Nitrosopumilus sp.]